MNTEQNRSAEKLNVYRVQLACSSLGGKKERKEKEKKNVCVVAAILDERPEAAMS